MSRSGEHVSRYGGHVCPGLVHMCLGLEDTCPGLEDTYVQIWWPQVATRVQVWRTRVSRSGEHVFRAGEHVCLGLENMCPGLEDMYVWAWRTPTPGKTMAGDPPPRRSSLGPATCVHLHGPSTSDPPVKLQLVARGRP